MGLPLAGHEAPIGFECRGIFSAIYLRNVLPTAGDFPAESEVRDLYESVRSRWLKSWLAKGNESFTRTHFIDPLLRELGWAFLPEQRLPSSHGMQKRPDYCLCRDEDAVQRAATADSATDAFRESLTVLEAKKVHTALDEISKKETPGWFPSQQIQDYLRHAKDASGTRFFDWAILSNGHEWRLYCDRAGNGAFFAFEIARDEAFCSPDEFRVFVALFRPAAFERRVNGRCLLDDIREESLQRQAELEKNLRGRVFDVLEELANGFNSFGPNQIKEADWPRLYDTCLIFLYRLLFILYAESRYLLPVRPNGPRSNRRYRDSFSLSRKIEFLRSRTNRFSSPHDTELYEQLLRLFRLIDGANPRVESPALCAGLSLDFGRD